MKRLIAGTDLVDLRKILKESKEFSNWKIPDNSNLQQEYNVEYKYHTIDEFGDIWPTFEDFLSAVEQGDVISLTEAEDNQIHNRSQIGDIGDLIGLVSSYRSWPEFRNMDTMADIINGFVSNAEMNMPIVLDTGSYKQIFSGNTRLDVAFMMKVTPQVLVIKVPEDESLSF